MCYVISKIDWSTIANIHQTYMFITRHSQQYAYTKWMSLYNNDCAATLLRFSLFMCCSNIYRSSQVHFITLRGHHFLLQQWLCSYCSSLAGLLSAPQTQVKSHIPQLQSLVVIKRGKGSDYRPCNRIGPYHSLFGNGICGPRRAAHAREARAGLRKPSHDHR